MRDRRVHQHEPGGHEQQRSTELHALGKTTGNQRRGDDGEGQLEHREHAFGDATDQAVMADVQHQRLVQPADEAVDGQLPLDHAGGVYHQAVAEQHPENADHPGNGEQLGEYREEVLGPHHAAVEQCQARDAHHQHEHRGADHPGGVAGVQGGVGGVGPGGQG
ncbi:hypothetical protein D3C85_1325150 [compost metagenome]